jgi:hypothetical protein
LPVTVLVRRSPESHTQPLRHKRRQEGDPVNTILLAIIALVAIAGPSILFLVVYRRRNPDRRVRWLRSSEDLDNPNPQGGFWGGPGTPSGG